MRTRVLSETVTNALTREQIYAEEYPLVVSRCPVSGVAWNFRQRTVGRKTASQRSGMEGEFLCSRMGPRRMLTCNRTKLEAQGEARGWVSVTQGKDLLRLPEM